MSVKVIFAKFEQFFAKFEKFSAPLGLIMVFGLAGLTFLNNQLNFDIPASRKVRDAAGFAKTFEEAEKLDLREISAEIAASYVSSVPVTYSYSGYSASGNSSGSFYISEPTVVSSPSVDAGYGIMRYIDTRYGYVGKFLYAHSTLAFSPLKSLGVGSTFTATIDGTTATYRVSARYIFNKSTELDGASNNTRRDRIYRGKDDNGYAHSLSLMTCGNGYNDDRNYRLVLFADRI